MESLVENKPLLWSVILSIIAVLVLVTGAAPKLCEQFSIVPFPSDVSIRNFLFKGLSHLIFNLVIFDFPVSTDPSHGFDV